MAAGSVAAITSAQAFHWFDIGRAWAEFARALRPGGAVAVVANARLRGVHWVDRVWDVMDRLEETAPWRDLSRPEAFAPHPQFSGVERASFRHRVAVDEQDVIARTMSVSHVAVLPASERTEIAREISAIVTEVDGPLEITYRTDVVIRRRI